VPRDMKKDWWFKFEHMAWLTDERLNRCSLETQGFWIRTICIMHKGATAKLIGTEAELVRLLSVTPAEFRRCVAELTSTKAATVTQMSKVFTLMSRKFAHELKIREQSRLRKRRERSHAPVTDKSQDRVISKSKELEEEKKKEGEKTPPKDDLGKDILIIQTESALKTELNLEEKRTVAEAIPPNFATDWGVYLRARVLKLGKNPQRQVLIQNLGYALTDYRRDHKKEYEQLGKSEPKLPTAAEVQRQREEWRHQPRTNPDGSAFVMRGVQETGLDN